MNFINLPEACSVERAPAIAHLLNNSNDVGFYCSSGERSRTPALLNAALVFSVTLTPIAVRLAVELSLSALTT